MPNGLEGAICTSIPCGEMEAAADCDNEEEEEEVDETSTAGGLMSSC